MGEMEKPNFYQNISEEELKRIRQSDPELAEQLKAEQQKAFKRQLRGDTLNPLTDLNRKLVKKMHKGYSPKKAKTLMRGFKDNDAAKWLVLEGEWNEDAIM